MKPLCVDLYCGLGGWTEALLAEGWNVIGFDNHRHVYGESKYPGQLVLQDVTTLHGSQFRNADLIVASPPCQEFSYMAMPWSRGKQIAAALRGQGKFPDGYEGSRAIPELTALFDACFRIQREASEAAGRYIPMVVENVKGAQPWVGRAKANFRSFYLWGDVEAVGGRIVRAGAVEFGQAAVKAASRGMKPRMWSDRDVQRLCDGRKNDGGSWFNVAHNTESGTGRNPVNGVKNRDQDGYERNHPDGFGWKAPRTSSRSDSRKAASAEIAKIPFPLAQWVARVFKPSERAEERA